MTENNLTQISQSHPIIIFDGECLLCDGFVRFVLTRDKHLLFRFTTLQYANTSNLLKTKTDSVILLYKGETYMRSIAALKILSLMGGFYKFVALLASTIPTFIADRVYDFIAKHRYQWFGKSPTCRIPDAKWKSQFIP
jgi:predicted DCC family thiol-disulfide oxidoreductase YuxK